MLIFVITNMKYKIYLLLLLLFILIYSFDFPKFNIKRNWLRYLLTQACAINDYCSLSLSPLALSQPEVLLILILVVSC